MILSAHDERQAINQNIALSGEPIPRLEVIDDSIDAKVHVKNGHLELERLNVRISKNGSLLSMLGDANKALQQQQIILEKLVVLKLDKQKEENRTCLSVEKMQEKLAEVRSRQSALEKRNGMLKELIAKQQELLQSRMQRRKALLERSTARTARLCAELRKCEEQAEMLQQRLDDEYAELDGDKKESQRWSERDNEVISDGRSEEWFAEDELSFSPEQGQDLEGYLQRKIANHPVVIRHPENFLREKSHSCCTRDELIVGVQFGLQQHIRQYKAKNDSTKEVDLDVTDIQEEDIDKALLSEQPLLTDLVQRSKSQLLNSPTEHSKKIKKYELPNLESVIPRNIGSKRIPQRNSAVFLSPNSWRSEANSSNTKFAKIQFPVGPIGLDLQ
jgi:hypothetical protein